MRLDLTSTERHWLQYCILKMLGEMSVEASEARSIYQGILVKLSQEPLDSQDQERQYTDEGYIITWSTQVDSPSAPSPDHSLTVCITLDTHPDEWEQMWAELAALNGGDRLYECANSGEVWQYICTSKADDGWYHHFRHRCHPTTHQRETLLIPAQGAFRITD